MDVFFVGLHCPLDELNKRELHRKDRKVGDAEKDFKIVHTFGKYDYEIDSTAPVGSMATNLIEAWKLRSRSYEFDKKLSVEYL